MVATGKKTQVPSLIYPPMTDHHFWQSTSLAAMTDTQWESLCDGCGKCCLNKLEDEDTGEIHYTRVACQLLDLKSCRCTDYDNRRSRVPDCLDLRELALDDFHWLPTTCAYRLLSEGKDLPDWHHLKTGRPGLVHKANCSIRGKAIHESDINPDDLEEHVIQWANP